MRAFLLFLALIALCLLLGVALAYPAFLFVHQFQEAWPIHRVAARFATLLLLFGLYWVLRHLRVLNRVDSGYGISGREFVRSFGVSLALGMGAMLPVIAVLLALDI